MRWFRWIPAQTGTSGLFRLVKQAQELYKLEVTTSQKSYKRFVIDFINSRQFHDDKDAWSRNEHQKNYKTVSDLLMNHEKAVRKYFDSAVFNEETISMLMVEFYSSDLPKKKSKYSHRVLSNTQTTNQNRTISQKLNKESIVVIVEFLNELNLFYEHLDADEVWIRYKEDRLSTVTCRHNTHLVLVLDRLALNKIIPPHWQSIISAKKLIISSGQKKHLDQHNMSSPLSRARSDNPTYASSALLATVDQYVRIIKEKKIK